MNALGKLLAVYRLRRQFYHWDRARLELHQQARLAELLSFARQNSPYYNQRLQPGRTLLLNDMPRTDKSEMMSHFDDINTAGLHKHPLIDFQLAQERAGTLGLFQGEYSVGVSSGTSGNKGLTVLSQKERELYSCLLWARSGIPAHIRDRRVLFALRTNNPAFMQVSSFGIRIFYVDYTHSVTDLINFINKQRLNILAGPPSLLAMIAAQSAAIDHKIEAVISYAEVLGDDRRKAIEEAFGVAVAQIYQGSEGFIASTCRCGNLHLNEDVIMVQLEETADTIGKAKNVVVTDLYRTTQPVIRYALNDILEISDEPCQCGSCFRVVERIHGRADDIFHLATPEGGICYLFPDYVQRAIIHTSDDIIEYQAIQKAIDAVEIRLVLAEGSDHKAIESAIKDNLEGWAAKAGGILGKIEFSNTPPERNIRSKKLIRVIRAF